MGAWILSVTGVIVLTALADILLPEGQTNKYIKGMFAVITLYVIISPLPKLLGGDYKFSSLDFGAADFTLDEEFLNGIEGNGFTLREESLESFLSAAGYKGVTVAFVGKVGKASEIDYINVYLVGAELPEDMPHNLLTNEIKTLTADFTGVDKGQVRVLYG